MKKGLRFLFTILLLVFVTEASAQTFAIRGGLNMSDMVIKEDGEVFDEGHQMRTGFHLGGVVEVPISETFSFEPGLFFSTKGFMLEEEEIVFGETIAYKSWLNNSYFDIPINMKAAFGSGNARFYVLAGPYIGIGLSGKTKSEITYQGQTETEEEDIVWGNDPDNDDLKRLEFGVDAGAGVDIKGIQIGVSYAWGLSNIALPTDFFDIEAYNRVLAVSVGYKFGKKE